jgi:ATP-binding cassette subfamily C (CFTR/MRP) protein 4
MKYRSDTEFVLKDLDLLVGSGEKIGCVGRTGAGKSTIINLLFRLQEIDRSGDRAKDSFIKIDETNTLPLGLHLLRGNISIIPQTPFMFTGTIRQNLDPLRQYSDAQIWKALEEVRLQEHVEKLSDKLNTTVNNASSVFSVGQKQLVCLARTLLRPCKVLVLDEATANMDTEIDDFIQKKIMEKFKSATVFTIAHRLSTIANYDKVLVLDKGRRIEFDEPYKLLTKNIGDETLTNPTGHFASMVMNTGPKTTQRIVNIARESYNKKHNIQN